MTRRTRHDGDPGSGSGAANKSGSGTANKSGSGTANKSGSGTWNGTNEGSSGLPGKRRFEKMASSSGTQAGRAYQGALESVFSIIIAAGLGYWADSHFGTSPRWLVVGSIVGFAAFVLRLARMAMLIEAPREPLEEPDRDAPGSLDHEETGPRSIDDPVPTEQDERRDPRRDETE